MRVIYTDFFTPKEIASGEYEQYIKKKFKDVEDLENCLDTEIEELELIASNFEAMRDELIRIKKDFYKP